jgi:predicted MFS family arabinose efflux permease
VPVLAVAGLVALALVGHYGAYTYITVLVAAPARVLPGGMGAVLLVFGVASAIGLALAGRVRDRTLGTLAAAVVGTALTLAGLTVAGAVPWAGLAVVVAWGLASGAIPVLAQTEIMRRAGDRHRNVAGAVIPVLFNGGIAIGAVLASLLAGASGASALPLPAAGVVLLAGLALALGTRRLRVDCPPVRVTDHDELAHAAR